MSTRNLPISEPLFTADDAVFDMSSYASVELFLDDVWNYVFERWLSRQSISVAVAAEQATLAQEQAEQFWYCRSSSILLLTAAANQTAESRR